MSYPAQEFFPEKCRACPTLVGYIEDGEFGEFPQKPLSAYYKRKLAQMISDEPGINDCTGPVIGLVVEEGEVGISESCGTDQVKSALQEQSIR